MEQLGLRAATGKRDKQIAKQAKWLFTS